MKEVDAYKLFAHSPGVIHSVDYSIATERGSGEQSKTVYVLLPYYRRGNLQDMINANLVNHTRFPEKRLMLLFLGVCRAMKDMHQYRGPAAGQAGAAGADGGGDTRGERMEVGTGGRARGTKVADGDDETEQQRPLMTEDERMPTATPGSKRSYAHRDIKPGNYSYFFFHPSYMIAQELC